MKDVQQHEQTERVEEYVVFPDHAGRTESDLFRKNKHILVHELNLPCFKMATQAGPNGTIPPEAYEDREVHHYLVEWATWNAVDAEKIQHLLDNGFFDPYGFAAKMKGQPFESPDDIRNLLVLNVKNHRLETGIHHVTAPEWFSDMVAKDGVRILLAKDEMAALASGQATITEDGHLVYKTQEELSK